MPSEDPPRAPHRDGPFPRAHATPTSPPPAQVAHRGKGGRHPVATPPHDDSLPHPGSAHACGTVASCAPPTAPAGRHPEKRVSLGRGARCAAVAPGGSSRTLDPHPLSTYDTVADLFGIAWSAFGRMRLARGVGDGHAQEPCLAGRVGPGSATGPDTLDGRDFGPAAPGCHGCTRPSQGRNHRLQWLIRLRGTAGSGWLCKRGLLQSHPRLRA